MNQNFIPFGANYYRATTPKRSEWKKDIENMREYGFNTIKVLALWRWNNPQKDGFYFEDLDELMDLAQASNIKVIINVLFDSAPAWFFSKYPDSVMITCDGRRVEPQTTAWRAIGGAPGPCYNHAEGIEARRKFMIKLVERYKNHPALYFWDLWNEPELTCGILRKPYQKDMVCYCNTCKKAFIKWLKDKYGSIADLNNAWARNYSNWSELELPRSGDSFLDMIDWRMFFSDVLTNELKLRIETVKKLDSKTPVMVHTVPIPYFNAVTCCNNDYDLAEQCDLFGNSIGSHPFAAAFNTSCAENKTVINSEIHALGGDTYKRPRIPGFEDIKGHIFVPLARGIKGFIYWQYRPETLGKESPAWGLTDIAGRHTDWLEYSSLICKALQKNADIIATAKPIASEVAIINSYRGQIFDWCASGSTETYSGSVIGLYMALYDAGFNADIIGLEKLTYEKLKRYKVILLPFPYFMDSKTASMLKQWVQEGGFLISEAFFGAVSAENGLHSTSMPGYGFTEVFGVKEGITDTSTGYDNAYTNASSGGAGFKPVKIKLERSADIHITEDEINGYYFRERLLPETADILGIFEDRSAAVTINKYGKGQAVIIGSLLGFAYYKTGEVKITNLIENLTLKGGTRQFAVTDKRKVRADVLVNKQNDAILAVNSFNESAGSVEIKINFDIGNKTRLYNIMTEEETNLTHDDEGYHAKIEIESCGHEVFRIE